ncbi:hypothetical protein DF16_pBMB95orf00032 (plasmid) [Bacillus thuringiensis serovar kurstaki str. YBT-1520]|nr:hypothetical protein DF16_pBMB95orf00032 [Bacillus thuringiensis serovar kurstaki str. YBT-1520]
MEKINEFIINHTNNVSWIFSSIYIFGNNSESNICYFGERITG